MAAPRCLFLALVGGLLVAASQVGAQDATGSVRGRIVDAASQQPLSSVNVIVVGSPRGSVTQTDGSYLIVNIPAGTHTVRASRIGYSPITQSVSVSAGSTATADFTLAAQAVVLGDVISVGYGTQKKEAITGSVATVNAEEANKGVVTNATQMLEGRVSGVNVTSNNGEPGAGSQIRIRGGSSISGSNDPLYVIDGVPIDNSAVDPAGINTGNGGGDAPGRNPLNLLNPSDIQTITVLKDASATAIYGSRGANGVILIETKNGEEYSGVLVRENSEQLVTRDATGREVAVAKNNLKNRTMSNTSLMPAGLIDALAPQERIDLFRFLSELGKPGSFDATKGNVARVWKLRPGTHTVEQFGEEKFVTSNLNGPEWTPAFSQVDGRLPADSMLEGTTVGKYLGVVGLYAAAQLQVTKAGPVRLKLSGPDAAPVWIDGKPAKPGAEITAELSTGSHTIVVRLDQKKLPPHLRLEASEGTFVAN